MNNYEISKWFEDLSRDVPNLKCGYTMEEVKFMHTIEGINDKEARKRLNRELEGMEYADYALIDLREYGIPKPYFDFKSHKWRHIICKKSMFDYYMDVIAGKAKTSKVILKDINELKCKNDVLIDKWVE